MVVGDGVVGSPSGGKRGVSVSAFFSIFDLPHYMLGKASPLRAASVHERLASFFYCQLF